MAEKTVPLGAETAYNQAQGALLACYCNGEFGHLLDKGDDENSLRSAIEECGDGLLRFLFVELGKSEDCLDVETAIGRVERAIEELQQVRDGLLVEANLPEIGR